MHSSTNEHTETSPSTSLDELLGSWLYFPRRPVDPLSNANTNTNPKTASSLCTACKAANCALISHNPEYCHLVITSCKHLKDSKKER